MKIKFKELDFKVISKEDGSIIESGFIHFDYCNRPIASGGVPHNTFLPKNYDKIINKYKKIVGGC